MTTNSQLHVGRAGVITGTHHGKYGWEVSFISEAGKFTRQEFAAGELLPGWPASNSVAGMLQRMSPQVPPEPPPANLSTREVDNG